MILLLSIPIRELFPPHITKPQVSSAVIGIFYYNCTKLQKLKQLQSQYKFNQVYWRCRCHCRRITMIQATNGLMRSIFTLARIVTIELYYSTKTFTIEFSKVHLSYLIKYSMIVEYEIEFFRKGPGKSNSNSQFSQLLKARCHQKKNLILLIIGSWEISLVL